MKQVPDMRNRRKEVDSKNALLAALAKSAGGAGAAASATIASQVDVSEAAADWDTLMASLTAHEDYLEHQKDDLARQIVGNIERFQRRVDALRVRWSEVKPTGVVNDLPAAQHVVHAHVVHNDCPPSCCWHVASGAQHLADH